MRSFNLPASAVVNKFFPKKAFSDKITNSRVTNGKAIFSDIEKITWSYKLSLSTIKMAGTKSVEEIQIFTMTLKAKYIPLKALREIKKLITYPILFVLQYKDDFCYGIALLDEDKYYFSNWNQEKAFNFTATNLEQIYQNIVKQFFLKAVANKNIAFSQMLELDNKIKDKTKEIDLLQSKINKEKQFNKKTEMNSKIKKLKKELIALKEED